MSKVKSSEKAHYELLYIIPNKFTDEEAITIDQKVKKVITDSEGDITYSEDWGKKKLAYVVGGYNHGYYKLVEFDLFAAQLPKLDNTIRLFSDVLRHQIIRTKKRSEQEIKDDKKLSEDLFNLRRSVKDGDAKPAEEKKAVVEQAPASVEVKKEEEVRPSAKKKADLKDLDKKLEDILDADDLI